MVSKSETLARNMPWKKDAEEPVTSRVPENEHCATFSRLPGCPLPRSAAAKRMGYAETKETFDTL